MVIVSRDSIDLFNEKNLFNEKQSLEGGRVVSASGSETSVWSSMPTSAIIYDAYTSIKKN